MFVVTTSSVVFQTNLNRSFQPDIHFKGIVQCTEWTWFKSISKNIEKPRNKTKERSKLKIVKMRQLYEIKWQMTGKH